MPYTIQFQVNSRTGNCAYSTIKMVEEIALLLRNPNNFLTQNVISHFSRKKTRKAIRKIGVSCISYLRTEIC